MTRAQAIAKAAALCAAAAALGDREAAEALLVLLTLPATEPSERPAPTTERVPSKGRERTKRWREKLEEEAALREAEGASPSVTENGFGDARHRHGDADPERHCDASAVTKTVTASSSSLSSDRPDPDQELDKTGDPDGSEETIQAKDQGAGFALEPSPNVTVTRHGDGAGSGSGDAAGDARKARVHAVVTAVFEHWVKAHGRNPKTTKLTEQREGKIRARLREGYSVARMKAAIEGCLKSDWHMENGHSDLETILKSGRTLEGHEARLTAPPKPAPRAPYQQQAAREPAGDAYGPPEPL